MDPLGPSTLFQMVEIHSFMASIPLCIYTTSLFIHMLMDTGCFHVLTIINSAAVNAGVHASFPTSVFVFFFNE